MIVNHQIGWIIFLSNPDVFWPSSPAQVPIFPVPSPVDIHISSTQSSREKPDVYTQIPIFLEAAKDNMFMVQSPFYLSTSLEQILNKRRPKKQRPLLRSSLPYWSCKMIKHASKITIADRKPIVVWKKKRST